MSRWFSAIETLAWLHSLNPDDLGLESFGKKTGFYARHCRTWSRIESQQAAVKDKMTGKPLGRAHERYDDVIGFVKDHLPVERCSIMHGDFKFDNLVCVPRLDLPPLFLTYYGRFLLNDAVRMVC